MNQDRINAVADAFASVGHHGIIAFDKTEPEYGTLEYLYDEFDNETYVKLLAICATTQDYQLNGNAQSFWNELERTASEFDTLETTQDVRDLLGDFMEADVNARLNQQKRDRLIKLFEAEFNEWFVDNHEQVKPAKVWERLADSMDNSTDAKTVILSMKVYDIAHVIQHSEYLEFPYDIPIPCDLQVERVSRTSGVTNSDKKSDILDTWAEVMERVSDRLDEHVSLLRIDSSVWQAGQIIGKHEPNREAAHSALIKHFDEVGVESKPARKLAEELTREM